ncbi:MAG: HU family DNA-binding protein [Alloprevotella sp.]|jgi:DNA-binding protein HU|nr:HU family DNA-binding protein [Alloprevotella sp.]RKV80583.1 MAG: HU family DNA-binding protein [Alloprevotella sp.]
MNNKEFINALATRLQENPKTVKQHVEALVDALANMLDEGATLNVQGFGTYEVKKKKERIIVHPMSKQRQLVPPKLVIAFKPSPTLKDKVNA